MIRVEHGQLSIEDLGSHNGTYLGDRRVEGRALLADGDVIIIGPEVLVLLGPAALDSTESDSTKRAPGPDKDT